MLVPIILCGGYGKRLWPSSRKSYPKQFLKLVDKNLSLLQLTAKRLDKISVKKSGLIVVCNEDHRFIVAEQLREIKVEIESIILEPVRKNTAPAITLSAIEALKVSDEAKLLIQTSDHIIPDTDYFISLIESALEKDQPILTFGVKPLRPETGYGYIEIGAELYKKNVFSVKNFVEKPNLDLAKKFLNSGKHLWNSGMFLLDAREYLKELENLNPQVKLACEAATDNSKKDFDIFLRVGVEKFKNCPSVSIDHAVMEKSKKISLMPFNSKWSDLGSWDAVMEYLNSDKNGNVIIGDVLAKNTTDTFINSEGRLVATLGVKNLFVIETPDAVLITSKGNTQNIDQIVNFLESINREEANEHVESHRPWGSFFRLYRANGFQVKKITVKPGKSLSLQSHKYRTEHWIVIDGVAEVRNEDKIITLYKNQSTYIQKGNKHRITNSSLSELSIIEVQLGSYLGEDDIVRYEDFFGRE